MSELESSPRFGFHPSRAELYAAGKALRDKCPRTSHANWEPDADRIPPLTLLERSNEGRLPDLIPIRYGRMLQSPFTFYRGSALAMAADLSTTPVSGLQVQACGDCHLSNFGAFATPERRVIFDINDLDETLRAPWEWDVKRLAASFVLASRNNGHSEAEARDAALDCVRAYREHMAEFAEMGMLEVWYSSIDMDKVIATIQDQEARKRAIKRLAKARERTILEHDYPEMVHTNALAPTIKDNPPLIFHVRNIAQEEVMENVHKSFERYRESLPEYRRILIDRYKLMDMAFKVVGIGSVGTYCGVMLLLAAEEDPLFLQVKEARASVLASYVAKSPYDNHGERVVVGHQLMQSASDLFLGWTRGEGGRDFYVRQLRDVKVKMLVDVFTPGVMLEYATLCGWTLARAHARSGEPCKISGYLGKSDKFDRAVADFAVAYADQCEQDHEVLMQAVREGKIDVFVEQD